MMASFPNWWATASISEQNRVASSIDKSETADFPCFDCKARTTHCLLTDLEKQSEWAGVVQRIAKCLVCGATWAHRSAYPTSPYEVARMWIPNK